MVGTGVARYCDPTTAQFLTRDPAEAITQQAHSYAHDNPLNEADPSGLGCPWNPKDCIKDVTGGVSSAAGAVSSAASATYNNVLQPIGSDIGQAASDIGHGVKTV